MNEREAFEMVRAIEHLWNYDMGSDGRNTWTQAMMHMPSAHASEAIIRLSERQRQRPTIADVRAMVRHIMSNHAAKELRPELNAPREQTPTWVNVWAWSRWTNNDHRSFPQQSEYVMADMSMDDYHALEAEWVAEGSPKFDVRNLAKALGA